MAKFATGTIFLVLKSDGPNITAGILKEDGYVNCFWFDNNQVLQDVTIHEDLLIEAAI
ncbi:hypothetical protein [Pedobacter sp. NJ-S-72]